MFASANGSILNVYLTILWKKVIWMKFLWSYSAKWKFFNRFITTEFVKIGATH